MLEFSPKEILKINPQDQLQAAEPNLSREAEIFGSVVELIDHYLLAGDLSTARHYLGVALGMILGVLIERGSAADLPLDEIGSAETEEEILEAMYLVIFQFNELVD